MEARILRARLAIAQWYTEHPVQAFADFEAKPFVPEKKLPAPRVDPHVAYTGPQFYISR